MLIDVDVSKNSYQFLMQLINNYKTSHKKLGHSAGLKNIFWRQRERNDFFTDGSRWQRNVFRIE